MSVYTPYRRPGGSEDLLALIALESDLVHALPLSACPEPLKSMSGWRLRRGGPVTS